MKPNQVTTTLIQFYNRPVAQVSLELFLSIVAVMFFAVFAIRPTLVTISDLIKEIDDKKALSEKMSQKIASLATIQTQYLSLGDRINVLDEAIPAKPKFEEALRIIERLASDRKLIINSIQVNEVPPAQEEDVPFSQKERKNLPVSVSVTGDYNTIRNFTEDLKNYRRALIVDSIMFSVNEEKNQKKLSANITINIQYFGSKAKVVAKPAAAKAGDNL
jgi:Tfp pilus assembly protein PilO